MTDLGKFLLVFRLIDLDFIDLRRINLYGDLSVGLGFRISAQSIFT